jgi:hypothetical protein
MGRLGQRQIVFQAAPSDSKTRRFFDHSAAEAFQWSWLPPNAATGGKNGRTRSTSAFDGRRSHGCLLTTAYPFLTLGQANKILTVTKGPAGGFVDHGSAFGVYSDGKLFAAAGR